MKKFVYIIWDDCTHKNIAAVATTESALESIGIREWEGRYRPTCYDEYNKGMVSACDLPIIGIKELKNIVQKRSN